MVCARCGGRLEQFELDDAATSVCDSCGFLDVSVSHERSAPPRESWEDAFDRFNARHGEDERVDDVQVGQSTPADD